MKVSILVGIKEFLDQTDLSFIKMCKIGSMGLVATIYVEGNDDPITFGGMLRNKRSASW